MKKSNIITLLIAILPMLTIAQNNYGTLWEELSNMDYDVPNDTITATAGNWTSGAISKNVLSAGQDGRVTYTAGVLEKKFFGLSTWNTAPGYSSIDYAIYLANGTIFLYEKGVFLGIYGSYSSVDEFAVERIGSNINYIKNGTILLSRSTDSALELHVDVSLYDVGSSYTNITTTFGYELSATAEYTHVNPDTTLSGSIDITVEGGAAPYTYLWSPGGETTEDLNNLAPGTYTVTVTDFNLITKDFSFELEYKTLWEELSNMDYDVPNDTITATAGNWTSGAISKNVLSAGEDGRVTYTAGVFENKMFGLSTWNTAPGYHSIDYAIYLSSGTILLFEKGVIKGIFGGYLSTDVFAVERIGSNINYIKNGTILLSRPVDPALELYVDVSLHSAGVSYNNITTTFGNAFIAIVDGPMHNLTTDLELNWSYGESYDENGNIIGKSKQYVDELGRNTQSLSFNIDKNRVLTSQTIYDKYGRPVINTMPATTGINMVYVDSFITNVNGDNYSYLDFDSPSTLNNPNPVGNTEPSSLGNYYSDNGEEDYVATSLYPYSRIEYMADPTGRVKRSAAPGENFKMGSGHENKVFYMFTGGELDRAFGVDSSFYCQTDSVNRLESRSMANLEIVADKTISVDAEGKMAITFKSDGLTIASCVSGMTSNVPEQNVKHTILYEGTRSVDIHLPEAKSTSLKFPLSSYAIPTGSSTLIGKVLSDEVVYIIMDLDSNHVLVKDVDYTITTVAGSSPYTPNPSTFEITFNGVNKHRFLRISYEYTPTKLAFFESYDFTPSDAALTYKLDYSHFTANYYDLAGRLRMNVSPKGFDYAVNGKHTEFSKYDYDQFGQLIAKETPDEGLMEYLYSNEGAVRFSQNAQQKVDSMFSYVVYDEYNRSVESGQYDEEVGTYVFENYYSSGISGGLKSIADSVDHIFDTTYTNNENYIVYDVLDSTDEIPVGYSHKNNYPLNNLKAKVSMTKNANNQTWYSYDYAGRPEYTVQELLDDDFSSIKDERIKTSEYSYAPVTSVLLKEEFQKNHAVEKLTHELTYNANLQLLSATATDNSGDTLGKAAFEYYINGQLKRKELDGDLQGIDYTYTLHGQLKTINHPSLNDAYDPGNDGLSTGVNANFEADVFGFALDYYQNDYERTGSNIVSSVANAEDGYNNGLIKATRWKIKDENKILGSPIYTAGDTAKELIYNYTYDDFYRFETAKFGVFDNDANSFTDRDDYKVHGNSTNGGVNYDIIGNITNLERYGIDDGSPDMDNLDYDYELGTSQLKTIKDNVNPSGLSTDFKTDGAALLFTYNSLGQMVASIADSVDTILYTPTGQVEKVTFGNGNTAEYFYNERNIKIKSTFNDVIGNSVKYNWYITDASGALKSVHGKEDAGAVTLNSQAIYGGGRLGMYDESTEQLNYELTDHLGNVRATIIRDGNNDLKIESWADYYPFGEVMPGRHSGSFEEGMFGYQGQEKMKANGNGGSRWYNFQLRMYNPSLGRWGTIDPYSQHYSPYLAMSNNPISYIDPDGGKDVCVECDWFKLAKTRPIQEYVEGVLAIPFYDFDGLSGGMDIGLMGGGYEGISGVAGGDPTFSVSFGGGSGAPQSGGGAPGGSSGDSGSGSTGSDGASVGSGTILGSPRRPGGNVHLNAAGGPATSLSEMMDRMNSPGYLSHLMQTNPALAKKLIAKKNAESKASAKRQTAARAREALDRGNARQYGSLNGGIGVRSNIGPYTTRAMQSPSYSFHPSHFTQNLGPITFMFKRFVPFISLIDMVASVDTRVLAMEKPLGKTSPLSKGEINELKKNGIDPHDLKPQQGGPGGKIDLFKDMKGNLFWKTQKGNNFEPIFENFYILVGK